MYSLITDMKQFLVEFTDGRWNYESLIFADNEDHAAIKFYIQYNEECYRVERIVEIES